MIESWTQQRPRPHVTRPKGSAASDPAPDTIGQSHYKRDGHSISQGFFFLNRAGGCPFLFQNVKSPTCPKIAVEFSHLFFFSFKAKVSEKVKFYDGLWADCSAFQWRSWVSNYLCGLLPVYPVQRQIRWSGIIFVKESSSQPWCNVGFHFTHRYSVSVSQCILLNNSLSLNCFFFYSAPHSFNIRKWRLHDLGEGKLRWHHNTLKRSQQTTFS